MNIQIKINIWELREQKAISLRELSKMSGVSKSQINDLENGQSLRAIETLCRLAIALNVGLDELIKFEQIHLP